MSTREEVILLFDKCREYYSMIQEYVTMRAGIDPEWEQAGENFDAYSDTIGFDPKGNVEIEWREWDRCGDSDSYHKEFIEREAVIAQALVKRHAATQAAIEKREREQLEALQRKYQDT